MPEAIQRLDQQALVWIAEHLRCGLLNPVVEFYTRLGNTGLLFIGLALLMLCFKRTRRAGASALCAMLIGLVVVNFTIKPLVSRPRPWLVIENFASLVEEHDPNSFPSGHTCAAFAAAMVWVRTLPQKRDRVIAAVMAVLMGLSRLYVGVHYPSDVLAGAVIGALCAWVIWKVYQSVEERRNRVY